MLNRYHLTFERKLQQYMECDLCETLSCRMELLEKCKQLIAHMMVEFSGGAEDSERIKHQLYRVQDRLDKCKV